MNFVNDCSKKPWRTIDVERNISLTRDTMYQDGRFVFKLNRNGREYRFSAFCGTENTSDGFNVFWKVRSSDLQGIKEETEIKKIISEALIAHGISFKEQNFVEVKFN